jgi:predicted adenylyl cyclase CyaB
MARNVEIKARHDDLEDLLTRVRKIADGGPELIEQDDTFFACATGRLKLRVFADGSGQLIAYERADAAGPKMSDYSITAVSEPGALRETLSRALGQNGRVIKRRTLYRIGRTRVHLDVVEGLGEFLELEVVLRDGESDDAGVREAHELLERLGIAVSQLVSGAYVDLMASHPPP